MHKIHYTRFPVASP